MLDEAAALVAGDDVAGNVDADPVDAGGAHELHQAAVAAADLEAGDAA